MQLIMVHNQVKLLLNQQPPFGVSIMEIQGYVWREGRFWQMKEIVFMLNYAHGIDALASVCRISR